MYPNCCQVWSTTTFCATSKQHKVNLNIYLTNNLHLYCRTHFFQASGGQQAATATVGSSLPYDSKTPSYSSSHYNNTSITGGPCSNYNLTNKVAATLLQLQDPVLHSVPGPPSTGYHPPPLKFVPGPLPQTTGIDHEGASPLEGTSSPTQPTSYQSAAQFMFQTGSAFPPFPTHNSSPCWSHSPWSYIPFGTPPPPVSGASHCPGRGTGGTGGGTPNRGGDNKINSCHVCGKTYARLSTLRSHLKSHSGEKPYQCSICQKSFTQAANLTAHLRTHSGEKPFKCPVCHRGFSQSSSVTTHMRTHSGDRPYKCNVCNKGFADSSTLTKHYRTHTGEKPYQCKICEAKFSQSGNLNRHMRTHRHHYGNGMDMRHI